MPLGYNFYPLLSPPCRIVDILPITKTVTILQYYQTKAIIVLAIKKTNVPVNQKSKFEAAIANWQHEAYVVKIVL